LACLGSHAGFSGLDWLCRFSDDVFPLNPSDYKFMDYRARTIRPEIPDDVINARDGEIAATLDALRQDRVDFATGRRPSRRQLAQQRTASLEKVVAPAADHPGRDLVLWLNGQPAHCYRKLLEKNWSALYQGAMTLPAERSRDATIRVLHHLQDQRRMVYGVTEKTPRIHAQGMNPHLLPRHLRKIAFDGAVSLDLRSAQLAIVAKLWGVQSLHDFLSAGRSIWEELYRHLDVGEECKPALKSAVYALTFGKGEGNLVDDLERRIPDPVRFVTHPLIAELLKARKVVQDKIRQRGRIEDAFGREVRMRRGVTPLSLLAIHAQSYELKIMLAVLPIVQAERDVRIVSWFHDGLTVKSTDRSEQPRQITRIKKAIDNQAKALGIPTNLTDEE
jgi:hypothetical protein